MYEIGSSPLARGTSQQKQLITQALRLIPARAGNIFSSTSCAHLPAAHPRSRGEHSWRSRCAAAVGGSSPLARGTRLSSTPKTIFPRLIPARAGNTVCNQLVGCRSAAHPRSRGEHVARRWSITCTPGSSPLARGTQTIKNAFQNGIRLIPARAGNTLILITSPVMISAHPRSRGEHFLITVSHAPRSGSSPLARGTCP